MEELNKIQLKNHSLIQRMIMTLEHSKDVIYSAKRLHEDRCNDDIIKMDHKSMINSIDFAEE